MCDVIRFSTDYALRKLPAGVLLKAGMQGAEIISVVEQRSSSGWTKVLVLPTAAPVLIVDGTRSRKHKTRDD